LKIIGIGSEDFEEEGKIAKDFGGVYIGNKLALLEDLMKNEDEVIIIDSLRGEGIIIVTVENIYPGIFSYNELENYLLNAKIKGINPRITIIAFSKNYEGLVRCFLNCKLSKK